MASAEIKTTANNDSNYITEEDIKLILSANNPCEETAIQDYAVHSASSKMLGFLAEYWKIKVHLVNRQVLYFFVKAISRANTAKAKMARETQLFIKELRFYSEIKTFLETPSIEQWSPRLVTLLEDALVFEDLNDKQYEIKNKFERFDMAHTLQALKTLARFHASSIVFEEKKKIEKPEYKINDDFSHVLGKGGYDISSEWFIQCKTGALEAIKAFSKYDDKEIKCIERHWHNIWSTALELSDYAPGRRNVICHRDLWNNNIMFHYQKGDKGGSVPDNCLFIDFQAVRYQPPASDVTVLLCCNLDSKFRKENMSLFLDFYYEELRKILGINKIAISDIITRKEFLISAEEQIKWGLVVCACLLPQIWIDDDLSTKIFCDDVQFDEVLSKNKGLFIKNMMENNLDYRQKVMTIFEELSDQYCFNDVTN